MSTKVHAATNALGNPVRFILTGGERLADKGYDGQRAMAAIAGQLLRSMSALQSWRKGSWKVRFV